MTTVQHDQDLGGPYAEKRDVGEGCSSDKETCRHCDPALCRTKKAFESARVRS